MKKIKLRGYKGKSVEIEVSEETLEFLQKPLPKPDYEKRMRAAYEARKRNLRGGPTYMPPFYEGKNKTLLKLDSILRKTLEKIL